MGELLDKADRFQAAKGVEGRYQLLVEAIHDYAIYMLDPSGIVASWNAGARRFKGYAAGEILGQHFSRFYTEEDQANDLPAYALATAAREGRFEREGWRVRKDGSRFWAHVVIDAIHNEQGGLVGFAKITRDITEKKQAEDALERANAALFQAQKMEAIGQLTGGIAHDFNNLLGVISSGLDMLSTWRQDARDIKMLESMQRAVERGATLTQQLLSFARQQPLKVDKHNLNTLIGGFEAVLRRAGNSSIAFEVSLGSMLKTVSIDATRFEAALLNLVVNARDAMPNGGRLVIATTNVELGERQIGNLAAGTYVNISVSDSGEGMPPEVAARAFEPFFTTKEIGKGTGLGLSQVYGFIAQSGGEVVIESEVGKGTTVSIYLPAIAGATDDTDADADTDTDTDTVLIVEDEADLRAMASDFLRSIGYEVLTAGNGNDAIEILKRRPDIDILFTDVMMPNGMSGIELARFTRTLCPGMKVILTSGYPLQALKAQHGNFDDFAFMSKPYRLSDLAKKLRATA